MRKLFAALLSVLSLPLFFVPAKAAYFSLLDLKSPQTTVEAVIYPNKLTGTQMGSFLNVVNHSTANGCLLPKVVCEDWSLLQIGGTFTGPNKIFGLGPQFNLLPFMGLNSVVHLPANIDLTGSAGPKWLVSPEERWKGYFAVTVGGSLKFNALQASNVN